MPKNLTAASTFTAPVSVPVDTDARNAASVETPFQALTNRTEYNRDVLGGSAGTDEWAYEDAPRSRVRIISCFELSQAAAAAASGSNGWHGVVYSTSPTQGYRMRSIVNFASLIIDLNSYLPDGGTLTRMRWLVLPGAARTGTNRMSQQLYRHTPNFATPGVGTFSGPLHQTYDDTFATDQRLDTTVISESIDKSTSILFAKLVAGNDAATNADHVHALEITYNDPGPLNL